MIPKDIESGEQWQVRFTGLSGSEVTRTGNKGQMVFLAKQRAEFDAVLERRPITVGAWEQVDPMNPDPEPTEEEA